MDYKNNTCKYTTVSGVALVVVVLQLVCRVLSWQRCMSATVKTVQSPSLLEETVACALVLRLVSKQHVKAPQLVDTALCSLLA